MSTVFDNNMLRCLLRENIYHTFLLPYHDKFVQVIFCIRFTQYDSEFARVIVKYDCSSFIKLKFRSFSRRKIF